jgi:hypothetical protein
VRSPGRSVVYCVALIPLAVAALFATLCGRADAATLWWIRLRTRVLGEPAPGATGRPRFAAVAGHAILSALLGAAALVPLGVEVLFVLRGVFYGFVDPGPYNDSWGGPSRAGAWTVHFLVSLPMAAAGIFVLIGIAAVHQRLTLALTGRRPAPWVIVVALVVPALAVIFFILWLHQI